MIRRILFSVVVVFAVTVSQVDAQEIIYDDGVESPFLQGVKKVYVLGSPTFENICEVKLDGDELEVKLATLDPVTGEWDEIEEEFPAEDVEMIIFRGGQASDVFYIDDPEELVEEDHPLSCWLIGRGGADYLSGGPNSDVIDGNTAFGAADENENTSNDGLADVLVGGGGNDTFVRSFRWQEKKVGDPNDPFSMATIVKYKEYEHENVMDLSLGDQYYDWEVDNWISIGTWTHWALQARQQRR